MGLNTGQFAIRKSLPESGNKFYNTKSNGGYSTCIQGSPVCSGRNVYSNCVGHVCGRFNEVYSLITGYKGMKYPSLNCNAENFITRAKNTYGLQVVDYPVLGGIAVWEGLGDLAGHVAFVEDIYQAQQFYSSESGYGCKTPFWNSNRTNSNGRYGMSSSYKWLGCIVNPAIGDIHWVENPITPNVDRDEAKNQIEVKITDLRVRSGAGTDKGILGFASKGYYNYYETADASNYTWYRIADGQWIASNEEWTTVLPAVKPEPTPTPTPTEEWPKSHTVVSGDTLSGIAAKYYGNGDVAHYNYIAKANNIANPNIIHTGQVLTIPEYKNEPVPKTEFNVGDKVVVSGRLYGSSYGEAPGQSVKGYVTTIALKTDLSRKAPYNIYGDSKQYLGWVTKDSIKSAE